MLGVNHHLSKFVRIGIVREHRLFDVIYEEPNALEAQPWNQYIKDQSNKCNFTNNP